MSATFNKNPYTYTDNPLSEDAIGLMAEDSTAVNFRRNKSLKYETSKSFGITLQYHRNLNSRGRNICVSVSFNTQKIEINSLSTSNIHLYQLKNQSGADSTYQTNRYNITPSDNWSYNLQATYTEPLFKSFFMQMNYRFVYSHRKSNRSTFNFGNIKYVNYDDVLSSYRDLDSYICMLVNPLDTYLDKELSRMSEYNNYTHNINVQLKIVRKCHNMNIGILIQPQRSYFIQDYRGISVDTVRNVVNITHTLNFRYRFNKRTTYQGRTSQPNISQMLDITDDSNPLNITKGNPGLKPSFTSSMRAEFNTHTQRYQRNIFTSVNFSTTQNSTSNIVSYDEATGGRATQPQNINGNWNTDARFMLNTALDTTGIWRIGTTTNFEYNNYVNYLTIDKQSDSQKNTTRTSNYSDDIVVAYNRGWMEVEFNGSIAYSHTRNLLQNSANQNIWILAYGTNITLEFPWGMSLYTAIH